MEDFFLGCLGLLACATPVAVLIAVAVFVFRKSSRDPRVDELELEARIGIEAGEVVGRIEDQERALVAGVALDAAFDARHGRDSDG